MERSNLLDKSTELLSVKLFLERFRPSIGSVVVFHCSIDESETYSHSFLDPNFIMTHQSQANLIKI